MVIGGHPIVFLFIYDIIDKKKLWKEARNIVPQYGEKNH
jgi:hypothetical protein